MKYATLPMLGLVVSAVVVVTNHDPAVGYLALAFFAMLTMFTLGFVAGRVDRDTLTPIIDPNTQAGRHG